MRLIFTKRQQTFPFWYALLHGKRFTDNGRPQPDGMYPFLSWCGLMLLGYCFGKLFTRYEGVQRRTILTWLGIGIILLFIALRATNLYGDPGKWAVQKTTLYTVFSFIDTQKYPPHCCICAWPSVRPFCSWRG
jgi:uncharacterized membrane protein